MRPSLILVLTYSSLALAFTAVSILVAPAAAMVGGPRAYSSIPLHLIELTGLGLVLGGVSALVYGRGGREMILLTPLLVVLLDLDHLPAYLGIAQPIRPAHSIVFILCALVFTTILLGRFDLDLVVLSSFTAHLGIDSGLFPPFSPISFQYMQLDPFRIPLIAASVLFALAAGLAWRRRQMR